jgi:hypothetical protein
LVNSTILTAKERLPKLNVITNTDRIGTQVTASLRVVVSMPIVVQPRLGIEILARQYSR